MGKRLVVGMKDTDTSLAALRWAIATAEREQTELVVIHAASIAITVRNGPSRAVAFKIGDPLWATIYSTVNGFAPPAGTVTVVEGGRAAEVLTKHAKTGDTIVLGPTRKRWFGRRSTEARLRAHGYDVRVVEAGSTNTVLRGPSNLVPSAQPTAASAPGQLVPRRILSPSAS